MIPARSLAFPLLLAGVLLVAPRTSLHAQQALPILEGFEPPAEAQQGALPSGWKDESFGDVKAGFEIEARRAKEGSGCLRMEVSAWEGGAARLSRAGLPLHAGSTYSVEVWLRGSGVEAPVELSLRKAGAPDRSYLAKRFAVGPEWRRCILSGACAAEDANGAVSVTLAGSATIWIDGMRVGLGDPVSTAEPSVPPAPRKGNQLYNSGFELDLAGWAGLEKTKVLADGAAEGKRYARWFGGPVPLEPRPFVARPNQLYTFSATLRSTDPNAKAELSVVELGGAFRAAQTFPLTKEWTRVSFSAALPCREYSRYYLALRTVEPSGPLDVDAVQAEEGELSAYRSAAALEVAAGLSGSVLFPSPNQQLTIPVRFQAREKTSEGCALHYRLEGVHGETVAFGTAAVPSRQERGEVPVRVRLPLAGTVRVAVEGLVDEQVVSYDEAVLTVIPEGTPTGGARGGYPAPGFHSWQGAEEQSRAAAVALVRKLAQERSSGERASLAVPDPKNAAASGGYGSVFSENGSLFDYDGSGKPTLAALGAFAAALEGTKPAGRFEAEAFRGCVFGAAGEAVAVLWAPGAVKTPKEIVVALPPRQCQAADFMGNRAGFRAHGLTTGLLLTSEPVYVRVRDVSADAVLHALKAGKLRVPAAKPAAGAG